MTETQKLVGAVLSVFIIGAIWVWLGKQESSESQEAASKIRALASMQSMANKKCPKAIESETGEKVYAPSGTKSDKETYITLTYTGEAGKYKTATCTVTPAVGGISELIIDGNVVLKK